MKRRTFSYVKRSGECNSHVQYIRFSLLNFTVEFGTLYYLRNMLCPCVKGDWCPQFCVHAGYLNIGVQLRRSGCLNMAVEFDFNSYSLIGAWKAFAKFNWTGQGCCTSVFLVSLFDCALRIDKCLLQWLSSVCVNSDVIRLAQLSILATELLASGCPIQVLLSDSTTIQKILTRNIVWCCMQYDSIKWDIKYTVTIFVWNICNLKN